MIRNIIEETRDNETQSSYINWCVRVILNLNLINFEISSRNSGFLNRHRFKLQALLANTCSGSEAFDKNIFGYIMKHVDVFK